MEGAVNFRDLPGSNRLGEEPIRELFRRVAVPVAGPGAKGAWYHGLRVMSIDGVVLDVPDTPENAAESARSVNSLAGSPYPQLRVVGLVECGTPAMVAAVIGSTKQGERELTLQLLADFQPGQLILGRSRILRLRPLEAVHSEWR